MASPIPALREAVRAAGLDGWLFYDFRRSNPIAHRILQLDPHGMFTRRWFYYVPAQGEPVALISAVEPHVLHELPGTRRVFQTWGELHADLQAVLQGARHVAMEYSPNNAIPVCSKVDAGTVELVRSCGAEVVSSANLAQQFEAVLSSDRLATHRRAAEALLAAKDALWAWIRDRLLVGDENLDEYVVQQEFIARIRAQGLSGEHAPIVAVNAHAGDPHYEPSRAGAAPLRRGDLLLLDFVGRDPLRADSVIADFTWMAALDDHVPAEAAQLFAIVCQARDTGIDFIRERVTSGQLVMGFEVDDVVRAIVHEAGYGSRFVHRSGHSITTETHGSGCNLDNLETHDDRLLLSGTICSMEPGIYLPHIGVRTEVNIIILDHDIEVTGVPAQNAIHPLLA